MDGEDGGKRMAERSENVNVKIDWDRFKKLSQEKGITAKSLAFECGKGGSYFGNAKHYDHMIPEEIAEKCTKILGGEIITHEKKTKQKEGYCQGIKIDRRVSQEKKEQIIECFLRDTTIEAAAKKAGVSEYTVEKIYSIETMEYAEQAEQNRFRRSKIRPRIIRTPSGLMYTR